MEARLAERLTPRSPDLEVRGSSLVHRLVFLDKELYSTLSLFTELPWVPATQCWGGGGGEAAIDWHPAQGGVAILIGMFHAKETGISYGRFALAFGPCEPLPTFAFLYACKPLPLLDAKARRNIGSSQRLARS